MDSCSLSDFCNARTHKYPHPRSHRHGNSAIHRNTENSTTCQARAAKGSGVAASDICTTVLPLDKRRGSAGHGGAWLHLRTCLGFERDCVEILCAFFCGNNFTSRGNNNSHTTGTSARALSTPLAQEPPTARLGESLEIATT